ncbi:MAG: hypothetical protein AAF620_16915 [Bacteroidota bacterium]
MRKTILLAVFCIIQVSCLNTSSQNKTIPVREDCLVLNNKLNAAYSNFIQGYKHLNAEIISYSYSENALLINVYYGSEPKSFKGRESIYNFFADTLTLAKQQKVSLKIIFKITDRQLVNETILDNGYYKLEVSSPNQEKSERFGKFSIVLIQELDQWKFSVDTNASSTKEEYQTAQSI